MRWTETLSSGGLIAIVLNHEESYLIWRGLLLALSAQAAKHPTVPGTDPLVKNSAALQGPHMAEGENSGLYLRWEDRAPSNTVNNKV